MDLSSIENVARNHDSKCSLIGRIVWQRRRAAARFVTVSNCRINKGAEEKSSILIRVVKETGEFGLLRRARECDVVAPPIAIQRIDGEERISVHVERSSLARH